MKSASVRELSNEYGRVLKWVEAGEEVLITRHGKVVAKLSPESNESIDVVNWAASPELNRDRSQEAMLSAEQSAQLLQQSSGKW